MTGNPLTLIQTMVPDGTDLRTVLRLENGAIDVGRVAPDGQRLAFSGFRTGKDKAIKLWLLGPIGEPQLLTERGGAVTAWSPDCKQVAFARPADTNTEEAPAWESFTIDVSTKRNGNYRCRPTTMPMTGTRGTTCASSSTSTRAIGSSGRSSRTNILCGNWNF